MWEKYPTNQNNLWDFFCFEKRKNPEHLLCVQFQRDRQKVWMGFGLPSLSWLCINLFGNWTRVIEREREKKLWNHRKIPKLMIMEIVIWLVSYITFDVTISSEMKRARKTFVVRWKWCWTLSNGHILNLSVCLYDCCVRRIQTWRPLIVTIIKILLWAIINSPTVYVFMAYICNKWFELRSGLTFHFFLFFLFPFVLILYSSFRCCKFTFVGWLTGNIVNERTNKQAGKNNGNNGDTRKKYYYRKNSFELATFWGFSNIKKRLCWF